MWRTYKNVFLLAEDNSFRRIDLGLVHSSAATSLVELILARLKQEDLVVEGVSPNFLSRYWPPALAEWSTKSVRDAFYASPKFPRLFKADAVRDTISRGLDAGLFAYVGKTADGRYDPFIYKRSLPATKSRSPTMCFLITREHADGTSRRAKAVRPRPATPGVRFRRVSRATSAVDATGATDPARLPGRTGARVAVACQDSAGAANCRLRSG